MLEEWEATKDTLHLWVQIIGKTRLAVVPARNHWWNVTLYPSARGLTTQRLPLHAHNLELEVDLVGHRVSARTTDAEVSFRLHHGLSVAEFHHRLVEMLGDIDVRVDVGADPFGLLRTTPVVTDYNHATYDTDAVRRFLHVLQWGADILEEFAGWYSGKSSPVHLFWHSFDLATSRFSGRRAPERSDVDAVTAEAYSHEIISFGFSPGNPTTPFPYYYSCTAPEPVEITGQALQPPEAEWTPHANGSLAMLRYDDVRAAADPRATLLEFLQSAYEAGASLAGWDLADTATSWCPVPLDRLARMPSVRATD